MKLHATEANKLRLYIETLPGYNEEQKSAFNGALRFLDADKIQLKEALNSYGQLCPNLEFFASDGFGVLFGLNMKGTVSIFLPETADIEDLDMSVDEFYEAIIDDPESTLYIGFYNDCVHEIGVPGPGSCFAAEIELALSGSREVSNYRILPLNEYLKIESKIAMQIHDLPNGHQFTNVVIETD